MQDNDEIFALSERYSPSFTFLYAGVSAFDPSTGSYNTDTNSYGATAPVLARNDSVWLNVDTPMNVYDKATGSFPELFPVEHTAGTFDPMSDRFYFQRTDYSSMGDLLITDANGTRLDSFSTDISGEAAIHFIDTVSVSVGPDKTVCASDSLVQVSGTSTTGNGHWISSGTGSFQDPNVSNAAYDPSNMDTANGSVQLSYISMDTGDFRPDTATVTVSFIPIPVVSLTNIDTTVNVDSVPVSGNVSGAWSDVHWSSYGNGFFEDSTALSTYYYPSQGDKDVGSVNLLLTATNNGQCPQDEVLNLNFNDTDIPEHGGENLSMKLHPVPASSRLFVSVPYNGGARSADYELIDLTGRVLQRGNIELGTRKGLDVEDLEPGSYFLRVRTEEDEIVREWVKR